MRETAREVVMRSIKDHSGIRYDRLTAVRLVQRCPKKRHKWLFKCDCGNEKVLDVSSVAAGRVKSCGCLQRERAAAYSTTHGLTAQHPREYQAWCHIKARCGNTASKDFAYYGGRGIRVCDRWLNDFGAFMADMGSAPEGCSIDRIDNAGNYEPGNCRWASIKEQANNRRNNRRVTVDGQAKNLGQWCEESGVGVATAIYRLKTGRTPEQAFIAADLRKCR